MISEDQETELQIDNEHTVWRAMSRLFPEVRDGVMRAELDYLERLPKWVVHPDIHALSFRIVSERFTANC